MMELNEVTELGRFLQDELTVSAAEIELVMQKQEELNAPIPMLLWQYGLVTCQQLDRLFDWLDDRSRLTLLNY
ncbi:MAG: DUF2949 domain-containing protein [Cyanophyceae cyanobacterium]